MPGNPAEVSEWLSRSQKHPLTIFAGFTDTYDHPSCRYQDSAAADLNDPNEPDVCPRHMAILSLDQLLPHRPRIRGVDLFLYLSDPNWELNDNDGESTLLHHQFFKESLPNLERLDFRALHIEKRLFEISTPTALFAMDLPRLKELKYLGVCGGLMKTAKDLTSCEIGYWDQAAEPPIIDIEELQTFFNNNRTLESLTINQCDYNDDGTQVPTALMANLKFLEVDCVAGEDLETILSSIHIPQLKDLDTVNVSFNRHMLQVTATNGSDHKFIFPVWTLEKSNIHPLRHLGAEIVTLRLGEQVTVHVIEDGPALRKFITTLDTVQVLELDGAAYTCVWDILSTPEILPRLKVVRVVVTRADWKTTLRVLASVSEFRMVGGNPIETIEPCMAERGCVLDQGHRAEWEKCFEEEGASNFLSK